jgi:multicomponent Na+:H+ antiporter subunit E
LYQIGINLAFNYRNGKYDAENLVNWYMGDPPPTTGDLLVPIVDTPATHRTVERAADQVGSDATLHLVALADGTSPSFDLTTLLGSVRRRATRIRRHRDHGGRVTAAGRSVEARWPSADDLSAVLVAYAREHGVEKVLVPPDVDRVVAGVASDDLAAALRESGIAAVTVETRARTALHRRLLVAGGIAKSGALFLLSLGFYLLLAGRVDAFEVVTGVATATVVAGTFGRVTFDRAPALGRSGGRALRSALYVPYLLWEVAKANAAVAAIVLDPRLPIDPKLVTYRSSLESELALTAFANSVTLTPGTLTVEVDADSGDLLVHTLTASSRADLREGSLERAVQFVFGRSDPPRGGGDD